MTEDKSGEIKRLKNDYFELIEIHREEREALSRVINTFGLLASGHSDIAEDIRNIKDMISQDGELAIDEIDLKIRGIKEKIITQESEKPDQLDELRELLLESCRIIKRIMAVILEDFYPITEEMQKAAQDIVIDCKGDIGQVELKKPSENFLNFIDKIKIKISDDFNKINRVFFILLEQVKDLEKSLSVDFGGQGPLKEIEYFEMKITKEVGSIAQSFDVCTTISELKKLVIEKLENIKDIVSLRKKEETEKHKVARENIINLNKKITDVEKKARKMAKKAERFQKAAMKDGLTGLFSRGAFDIKIDEVFRTFKENGEIFSLILFDVDKFKSINDSLGHIAGDKVLKKVAECLEETFRKDDFIARFGGDEFVVVIEELTEDMALDRISKFNKNLKKRRFVSHKAGEVDLSVSAGTATVNETDTIESIIGRADKAMYDVKSQNA